MRVSPPKKCVDFLSRDLFLTNEKLNRPILIQVKSSGSLFINVKANLHSAKAYLEMHLDHKTPRDLKANKAKTEHTGEVWKGYELYPSEHEQTSDSGGGRKKL